MGWNDLSPGTLCGGSEFGLDIFQDRFLLEVDLSCHMRCHGLNVRVPQINVLNPNPNVLIFGVGPLRSG